MFTAKELDIIDREYFRVIRGSCYAVTIQSRNTGHCWHILSEEYRAYRTCRIYHTHHQGTAYHLHGHGSTLESCIRQIQSHDSYQLEKDRRRIARIRAHHHLPIS